MTKLHTYQSDRIEVQYDLGRCIHAAECVRGLPSVFDPQARPWVQPANAEADQVASVVERCPTGALTYTRLDGGDEESGPEKNVIQVMKDGPIYIHGTVQVNDPGARCPENTVRLALCRCGASSNKPFCDNSHVEAGFTAD